MKKRSMIAMAAAAIMACSCNTGSLGGSNTGSAVGGVLNGGTVTNVLNSILGGSGYPTIRQIAGNWHYSQPGCAFTSSDLLTKAGGEVVAGQIKQKLASTYSSIGIKPANTAAAFDEQGKFTLQVAGKSFGGTYTYDEKTGKMHLQGVLIGFNCYVKRNADGIALLFEASKLLSMLQVVTAMSGNSTLQGIGDLSKNYDGLRIGFDLRK